MEKVESGEKSDKIDLNVIDYNLLRRSRRERSRTPCSSGPWKFLESLDLKEVHHEKLNRVADAILSIRWPTVPLRRL